MTPAQLANQLRISANKLSSICARLQIALPDTPGGTFSSDQVRTICDFVDAQRRAQTARAAGQELGGHSYGDAPSIGPQTPRQQPPSEVFSSERGSPSPPSSAAGFVSIGGKPTRPRPASAPQPPPPPVGGIASSIAQLPLELGFETLKTLGEGGMGSVLLARERSSGREVAIKRLKWGGTSEEALDLLITEFRNGCKLSHLHIVRFLAVNRDDNGPYFTMEYVDGESLAERLKRGPLDLPTALELFTPLADALQHAHDQSQIHRDIKPGNILLTKGGMPKLADFGLAMNAGRQEAGSDFVGTLDFMPPEQRVDSRRCTAASDQWSFAATLYYSLTKLPPREYDPAKVPAAIRPVLTRALQDDPNKRFPSMAELAQALERCARHIRKSAAGEEPVFQPAPSTSAPVPEPVNALPITTGAAALGAVYGFSPNMLLFWLPLIAGGVWWGHAFLVKKRGMATAPGMVVGVIAAIGVGIFVSSFAAATTLLGMAAGALCFGVATSLVYRDSGFIKLLTPSLSAAALFGGIGLVWLVISAPFTSYEPSSDRIQGNGSGVNDRVNSGTSVVAATPIEPNDLVFSGQESESNRAAWKFRGHLKTDDHQVSGNLTFQPVNSNLTATMEVEGTFDGWRLELTGKSVSNPNLIAVGNYVLTFDEEAKTFSGQLVNSRAKLDGTVEHWPENSVEKFVPDGVVDEFAERFDSQLAVGQLPEGWSGDTTIGLVDIEGRRGLAPSGVGEHSFTLPPLKLHGDFLFETAVIVPERSDNTLRMTLRGSPGRPDLIVQVVFERYGGEQFVSIAGGEQKAFPVVIRSTHRLRLEKRGDVFSFYQNGFLVHSARLPRHVSFDGISGRITGNPTTPILAGFRVSGLGSASEAVPTSTTQLASLPVTETFVSTPLHQLPANWIGPTTMGVVSVDGAPALAPSVKGLHSAVMPPSRLEGDFTAEFDYFVTRRDDQLAEFTLLGQRGAPDLNVSLTINQYGGETFTLLDGTDAKSLKNSPSAGTLSIKRTGEAFVVALNGTTLNSLRIPLAGNFQAVRITLSGGEPIYLKAVRLYNGDQRPTTRPAAMTATTDYNNPRQETNFLIKSALAQGQVSEQVTLTISGQTFQWEVSAKTRSVTVPIKLALEPGTYPYKLTAKALALTAPNRPAQSFTCETSGELTIANDKIFTYVNDQDVDVQARTYKGSFR